MSRTNASKKTVGPVLLTPEQSKLRDRVRLTLDEIRKTSIERGKVNADLFDVLTASAHELHESLKASGVRVRHHKYMIENRGMQPDDPEFYRHVHPSEDLLKFIEEQSANDDPQDQTLDEDFSFRVYSRRWGHDDHYHLIRTKTGWTVRHMEEAKAGRDGRVRGQPGTGLFQFLDHDSINYPEELPAYLEWLWDRAASDGLTSEQVQEAVNQLAEWVNTVEKSSPGGVFRGYK